MPPDFAALLEDLPIEREEEGPGRVEDDIAALLDSADEGEAAMEAEPAAPAEAASPALPESRRPGETQPTEDESFDFAMPDFDLGAAETETTSAETIPELGQAETSPYPNSPSPRKALRRLKRSSRSPISAPKESLRPKPLLRMKASALGARTSAPSLDSVSSLYSVLSQRSVRTRSRASASRSRTRARAPDATSIPR